MDRFQAEVRSNFRTEMFAFALYTVLGNQYKNFKPNFGELMGYVLTPIPLSKKLKMISDNEASVVVKIEKQISDGADKDYLKVLKRILPDEIAHSKIYFEAFGDN